MDLHNFLWAAFLFLFATILAVPLSKRLGLGSVLGYLFAGLILGPAVLGQISNPNEILHFSEFGVVLLLFLIGLELNLTRLWRLRTSIFLMGGLQVLLSAVLIGLFLLAAGLQWPMALVISLALSLSSTAIVLQIMSEKNLVGTDLGQKGFSILLCQDLAIIPMLAILPLLAPVTIDQSSASDTEGWQTVLMSVAAILGVMIVGRFLLRPLLRYVAATNLREVFVACSLLVVVGIAILMDSVGLSMALGTFLAGVLLADSEYRYELEIDIEPFKGLLLGLFFMSVGMSMNVGLLIEEPLIILGLTFALIALKALVIVIIAAVFRLHWRERPLFALLLAQGGEFAFVLFAAATAQGIMPDGLTQKATLVVALSMFMTPLLLLAYEHLVAPYLSRSSESSDDDTTIEAGEAPVLILGFGRFGQIVGRMLHSLNIQTTVLDHDANQIALLKRFGFSVYFGDAARRDILESAGIGRAKILVLAIDDVEATIEIAKHVQSHYRHLKVLARVRNRAHAYRLMDLGVESIFRETFDSSVAMASGVLRHLGFGAYHAKRLANTFARHDELLLRQSHEHYQDEKMVIAIGKRSRSELESLMNLDLKERYGLAGDAWNDQVSDVPPAFRHETPDEGRTDPEKGAAT